jgi:hypothetical protein
MVFGAFGWKHLDGMEIRIEKGEILHGQGESQM